MGGGDWPVLSVSEARKRLCEPGSLIEFEVREINGAPVRVWKNGPQTLPDLVRAADSHGEREFLVLDDERVSFRAFCKATARLAEALRARGVVKGDRVAIAMRNLPEFPVVFFAAAAVGAIVVPLNAWWTEDELVYALKDSGARTLICDAERWAVLANANLPVDVLVCREADPVDADRLEDVIGAPNDWA
ncbi:unnamed protein product, partial [Chrysoparadoxa australica]